MPNTPKGLTYPSNSSPVAVPADLQELATDVDGLIVPNTGGTYTGSVSFTQSPSVPTPTSGLHATNKTYVDAVDSKFRYVGNLFSENQASVETDTSGFYTGGAATLSRSTAYADYGSASLAATSTSSGTYGINVGSPSVLSSMPTVEAGFTYTTTAKIRCSTSRSVQPRIYWRDAAGAALSNVFGPPVTVGTSGFTEVPMTATAPTGAKYAVVEWLGSAASAGEVLYFDRLGFWKGTGGQWELPGREIVGLKDGLGNVGNLLTSNQAYPVDTSGWSTSLTLSIAVTGSIDISAANTTTWQAIQPTSYIEVDQSVYYTLNMTIQNQVGTRLFYPDIWWLDSNKAIIYEEITYGASNSFQRVYKSPSNAKYALIGGYFTGGTMAVGDKVRLSNIGFWKGAGGLWSLPLVPVAGQSHVAINGAVHLSGTGSPESVISAAPGSTYLQTDSVTDVKGWIRWIKSTGTGNTGWQVGPEADTGWRNVTALMESAFKTSNPYFSLLLRRVGSRVTYACNETVAGSATGTVTIYNAPAGFRETVSNLPQVTDLANANTGGGTHETLALNANTLYGFGWTAIRHVGHLTFDLSGDAAWPSSLPGSAA